MQFVEDVGRHNAVDAIAGKMWLDKTSGADKVLYTAGRLTSEMVIKGAQMGIPIFIGALRNHGNGIASCPTVGYESIFSMFGQAFFITVSPTKADCQ
jgi:FdhD protein